MKLIVGLGNPGKEYENTRHNIGFMVIDKLLDEVKYKNKFEALYYIDNSNNVIFIKPQTYMNLSGLSVKKFVNYYNIKMEDIMVIQDDLDLNFGNYKFKFDSSSGGHNGIKSIIENLNSKAFFRMKIGILNQNKKEAKDFVLSKFSSSEISSINFDLYISAINDFIEYDKDFVMNKYNG